MVILKVCFPIDYFLFLNLLPDFIFLIILTNFKTTIYPPMAHEDIFIHIASCNSTLRFPGRSL